MRTEITSAADFLVDLVRAHNSSNTLNDDQLQKFRNNVCDCLARHYVDHWFPSAPMKGSGYRCIRINGKMDPLIARAGCMMGLAAAYLRAMFPSELTMWVDPSEVSYRIGENGSICVLYEDKIKVLQQQQHQQQQQQQQHQTPNTPPRTPPPETKHSSVNMLSSPPPPSSGSPPPSQHQTHLQHHHHHQQQQQQQQQHFSPSKSMIQVSTGGPLGAGPSPPLSPVTTQQQAAQQQAVATAMQLSHLSSMFLPALAGHQEKATLAKCKESLSLRLDSRSMLQDRLFVSS